MVRELGELFGRVLTAAIFFSVVFGLDAISAVGTLFLAPVGAFGEAATTVVSWASTGFSVFVFLLAGVCVVGAVRSTWGPLAERAVAWAVAVEAPSPQERAVAEAQEAYTTGEIGEAELERRLAFALDDDAQAFAQEVEAVDGLGPELSARLREEFGTLGAVREATDDELQAVHGIGEKRVADVREAVEARRF